jgi:4-hydroxyphenylpyruvate dioxygenase-like putative hemolysin
MGRRKKATERVEEIKDQAKAVAGEGGEALKDFASQTGTAAKEFASKASDAAKELVESIEKAAKGVDPEPRKSRRLLKLTLAIGIGTAVFANERARSAISKVLGRGTSTPEPPEVWRPDSVAGTNAQKATTVTGTSETPL